MSLLETAKAKAAKTSLKGAFKNEDGAIDLASIMVGIIVIGLIGGVIAATVFAVIPWAQDNAAKQQLESVVQAQNAYLGLSAEGEASFGGTELPISRFSVNGNYQYGVLDDPETPDAKDISKKITSSRGSLFDGSDANVRIASYGESTEPHYAAVVSSDSGKIFYVTDANNQAVEYTGELPTSTPMTGATKEQVDTARSNAIINYIVDGV